MSRRTIIALLLAVAGVGIFGAPAAAQLPAAKLFPDAPPTTWRPLGCRAAPAQAAALPSRAGWRNLHGDEGSSDEVSIALAPQFAEDWTAEAATYNPTGPVFDSAGNLYLSPLLAYEDVILLSLSPVDGSRRWAIAGNGSAAGGGAPMVLADPDTPGAEIVYLALYDRAVAVRTDGSIVWDVPTGLMLGGNPLEHLVLGTNYVPARDAIAGLTGDGHVFLLDRQTGAPLLAAPFALPGVRSPAVPSSVPAALMALADTDFRTLVDAPAGGLPLLIATLLGNDVEVGNMFSVDPRSGRLWIAATAPDGEDGSVDGVSQLGALYGLDVVPAGPGYALVEACHRSFAGGSASTPTLSADGTRIYLGDNFGALLAIDAACNDLWSVGVGAQIFGSVAVASDNREIYASSALGITKVVDDGASGRVVWTANLDVFDLAPGQQVLNMNLVAIGANGLFFQAGAGTVLNATALPSIVGSGVLDRDTGAVRTFAGGGEETVAVMSTGPDGAVYLGNSPLRRLFARRLGLSSAPLVGGVTKFAPRRLDLLMRDAACAAQARAENAYAQSACPAGLQADIVQIRELIAQVRGAAPQAVADGELKPVAWARLDRRLVRAEPFLQAAGEADPGRSLLKAARKIKRVCRKLSR